jgi:acetyl-CoA acetyltransferase
MTRAPCVLLKHADGLPRGHATLHSTTLGWRMVNPDMPARWTVSLGEATEILAGRYGIARDAQDAFALRSDQLAHKAWAARRWPSRASAVDPDVFGIGPVEAFGKRSSGPGSVGRI